MELVWRPLTMADIPAVAALYNAAEAVDDTGELLSEEDFAQSFGDSDLPGGSLAVLADGRLVAYGLVALRDNPVGTHRVRLDGMVHPEHRRAGIGLRLLPRLAALARDLHVARHPALPLAVCTMVESRSEGHVALVEKLGFGADRHFYELEVALGESLAQVPVPAGYEIVPFSAARDEEVRLVSNAAFAQHWGVGRTQPRGMGGVVHQQLAVRSRILLPGVVGGRRGGRVRARAALPGRRGDDRRPRAVDR
ncbi:GNAT family N-acetyltransferase [Lentzea sp. NEAU-D7]|uniref:GNAT family N-acetyltransferase n=1 Tax=Lentzea sp. NEAU-D7 TaxID=2994667 RepID=UPI00224B66E6|nr:GNAT family N-acetyltransferase [Lentzea sp. NEAU-D7]MCX2954595.1 GNAT family N-acetyltransferase [Lentzea sp. NEAU-D7]